MFVLCCYAAGALLVLLSEAITLLLCKELAVFFQKFPFVFPPVFQIPVEDVRVCSLPEHHEVLRGNVICICMSKLTVWRHVLMLIDFLSLFHVQMICYITAININNFRLKNVAQSGSLVVACAKGKRNTSC